MEKHCVSWEPIKKSEDQEVDCTSLLYSMIDRFIKSCVHSADRMTGPAREEEEILLLQACHNCHRNICCDSVSPTIVFPGFCSQIYAVAVCMYIACTLEEIALSDLYFCLLIRNTN